MIYVICLDTQGFDAWRESVGHQPSNRQCTMLRTALGDQAEQLRERRIGPDDQVIRWGDYEQGLYWHDVEDLVAERTIDSPGADTSESK